MLSQVQPIVPNDLIGFAIAHEVRNLLTPARAHLECSTGNVSGAIRAIDRALEFADVVLSARPGSVCRIEDAITSALATLTPNRCQIMIHVEPGATVSMPQIVLERIIGNIVMNSVHAIGPRPGTISLHAFDWNCVCRLQIVDTGPGMPQRPHAPTRGRGLQICAFLVEQCGGRLIIDQRPGHGTTVTLDLPVPSAQRQVA